MSTGIASSVTAKVIQRITSPGGVDAGLAALSLANLALGASTVQILPENVAAELAGRSGAAQYPAASVYCEKIVNDLTEKFRRFSGSVHMAIELRYSQDRLEGIQDRLEILLDAVTGVLDGCSGDWGDGAYYGGGYEVSFGAVKHGGKNFIQTAKVTFKIGVSKS